MFHMPIATTFGLHRFFGMLHDNVELMQFTGLTDKNGVEIYEGDICKLTPTEEYSQSESMTGIREVYWDDNDCRWYFTEFVPLNWGGFESIEVIGNIHQHPELLK